MGVGGVLMFCFLCLCSFFDMLGVGGSGAGGCGGCGELWGAAEGRGAWRPKSLRRSNVQVEATCRIGPRIDMS